MKGVGTPFGSKIFFGWRYWATVSNVLARSVVYSEGQNGCEFGNIDLIEFSALNVRTFKASLRQVTSTYGD